MTTTQVALSVVMLIACLFLIIVVLLQNGAQQGLGVISGGAETFFSSGKVTGIDKILARLTTLIGILFAVIAVLLNLV